MSENLALWNHVERTDPSQVKPITGKPYKGNSPKPYYLIQKATETFGPCGIGWGFEIVTQGVVDGAAGDKVHVAHVRVWYNWKDQKGFVEHVGQTMFCGKRKDGSTYTDEDAPKKSVTDALVKALSLIGFAGDIFIGRYDDSKYVADLTAEVREAANDKANEHARQIASAFVATLQMAQTLDDLSEWAPKNKAEISRLPTVAQNIIREAYTAHRTKLAEADYKEAAE
jgi:hypothetical protein